VKSGGADVKVVSYATELPALPPDEIEKLVVAFQTPASQATRQKVTLTLLERNGSRHVTLEDLDL